MPYKERGKFEQAERLYQEVFAAHLAKKDEGPDHPGTLSCKNNLAVLYQTQGKYDRAEPLLWEVVASFASKAMTPRILALAGSLRRGSFNKRLVPNAAKGARDAGAEVRLIQAAVAGINGNGTRLRCFPSRFITAFASR